MRHHNVNRKFGRQTDQRRSLLRSLAENLIVRGKILTTEAKAKELRPFIEKLVTKGRDGALASRRALVSRLGNPVVVKKLVDDISKKYLERKGGYTRIVKMGQRKGDASEMALIEFV
ncbi:MAG: 50S ribosomal protein L17 [Candidatus Vogelbacteria bacterium]|nr:50S ribosomal protein L17 [Candidatus Vogelbacteria bacterium]